MKITKYLQAHEGYFWEWGEDNGERLIAIPNSNTIAYNAYLFELFDDLAPQGLPPFGTLILAILATNRRGEESINTVYFIMRQLMKHHRVNCLRTVDEAIWFLKLLARLPKVYHTKEKRKLLFMSIFEDCHNISSAHYSYILAEEAKYVKIDGVVSMTALRDVIEKDFKPLSLLGKKFRTVDDIFKVIAGLPDIEENINIESEENEPLTFVEQLINDPKTFEIGVLIKRIWSGLNIPTRSLLPSDQPLGGVSDLTNKGNFDRLLISEYANDDIVFLSRLANNEALYFHRETPPADNKLERVILIDISLKNWGIPKTMAHSVMLAIANHPKTEDVMCKAFVVGKAFQDVKIDTINEVIDSMQYVDTCLHPASGLEAFFKAKITDTGSEVFFITTPSTLKNPTLMQTLSEYQSGINYLISCDIGGEIDIYKNRKGGRKHLQHVKLPLGELWQKKNKSKEVKEDLLRAANYPILVNYPTHSGQMIYDNYGVPYLITKEKKILMSYSSFSDNRKGWDIIYEGLPTVQGDFVIARKENWDLMLLHYDSEQKTITIRNLSTDKSSTMPFPAPNQSGRKFYFYEDYFYLYSLGAKILWEIGFQAEMIKVDLSWEYTFDANKEREATLHKANENLLTKTNILKNVHRVYINQRNRLVFSKHELQLDEREYIRIVQEKGLEIIHSAERISENLFRFDDGSEVEINRSGLIILRSSHQNYSDIYIPSTLKRPIGLATPELCTGEFFYEKNNLIKIVLTDAGGKAFEVAEVLGKEINLDSKTVKNIARNIVSQTLGIFDMAKVENIMPKLEALGAKASCTKINQRVQTRVDNRSFFNTYINGFIEHIIDNAT